VSQGQSALSTKIGWFRQTHPTGHQTNLASKEQHPTGALALNLKKMESIQQSETL